MDWCDPTERLKLLEELGPREFGRQLEEHEAAIVIEVVNGYPIRPAQTRFGTLFALGGTGDAYGTLERAREVALQLEPRADSGR